MTDMDVTARYREARDLLLAHREEHEVAVSAFAWPDLGDRFNWAVDWFDAYARGKDDLALKIVEEDGTSTEVTFDAMAARSDRVAHWLAEQGVRKGDPVILMLGNQVELWDLMLGVMKLGAVIMPTTTASAGADLADRITRGGARHVVTTPDQTAKFADLPGDWTRIAVGQADGWLDLHEAYAPDVPPAEHPGTAPTDPLLLYFTSGTTSRPKLVEHTQQSYPRRAPVDDVLARPAARRRAPQHQQPRLGQARVVLLLRAVGRRGDGFLYNYTRFDAGRLLEVLRDNEVTSFCAPPTVWRMLINADLSEGPGSLREVIAAGEPLNPEVIAQVRDAWGLTIRDGYGQTEMTAAVGNTPGSPVKPGSMGRPLPGIPSAWSTRSPASGSTGRARASSRLDLAAHPLPLMTGYQGDDERNAEAMAGGWYHTGDVASRDAQGWITYVGRTDDVFKASDYKISPFELESVLIEHPAVAEAAVVPAPDEVRLAVPKAYIALAPGHEPDEDTARSILAHAREHLSPWQRVRRIEFAELPKTISGKIRRVELRGREEQLASGEITGDGAEWRDDQFPELRG